MSLELYLGSMFSGKSSAVISAVRRNTVIGINVLCITHKMDTRYKENAIVSHNGESFPAVAVEELLPLLKTEEFRIIEFIVIEEAHFFPDLKQFVITAVDVLHKNVLCVGLDGDFERKPFGQILDLIPYCNKITKFKAYCSICRDGTEACFTHRISAESVDQVSIGGADQYQALCRSHYLDRMIARLCTDEEKMKDYLRQNVLPISSNHFEYLNLLLEHVPLNKSGMYLIDAYPIGSSV